MKISNTATNAIISIFLGLVLTFVLTQAGCQKATKEKASSHSEEGHSHGEEEKKPPMMKVADAELSPGVDLDSVVTAAVNSIEKGKSEGDMNLVMNEGIMKLRAVLEQDPDNETAILQMGLLSLESGQIEKAAKRFEKLVLLQPENQEYARQLEEIRNN